MDIEAISAQLAVIRDDPSWTSSGAMIEAQCVYLESVIRGARGER